MKFRFINIPVQIQPTFWIFLLFFTDLYRNPSLNSLIVGAVLIVSLLVHEYGHARTALHFGANPEIFLEAFGGRAQYSSYGLSSKQEFLITLNGPLLESTLIIISYFLLKLKIFEPNSYMYYALYITMRLNTLWCLFNLIPIGSLDGGHLCRYLLEKKFGQKGQQISFVIGIVSAIIAIPYYTFQGFYFFGILLVIFAFQSLYSLQETLGLFMKKTPFQFYLNGVEALDNNELERAKAIFKKLLKARDIKIKNLATESLAQVYFQLNESQKSYDLLLKADPSSLQKGKCLFCKLAFQKGNYEFVAKHSNEIYEIEPTFELALLISQSFAWLNQASLAGGWLFTASQFGEDHLKDLSSALQKECYSSVKKEEAFEAYLQKMRAMSPA